MIFILADVSGWKRFVIFRSGLRLENLLFTSLFRINPGLYPALGAVVSEVVGDAVLKYFPSVRISLVPLTDDVNPRES